MPQRMFLINDPDLSEYFFHCFSNAPREKVNSLSANELKYFKDAKTIRRFADGESLEKRLLMLTRLGYSFCVVMSPEGADLTTFKEIPEQFENEKRLSIVQAMNKGKVFVLSSRDVLMSAHMAAQNSHSQVYVLNYEYAKLRQNISKFSVSTLTDSIRDAVAAFDDLAKIIMHAMVGIDNCQALTGAEEDEVRVLLAMLPHRNNFMTTTKIAELVNDSYRSTIVPRIIDSLIRKGFIEKTKGAKETRLYTIMEPGIDAAMNFLKYVVKQFSQ